jgi:hypothetical protein
MVNEYSLSIELADFNKTASGGGFFVSRKLNRNHKPALAREAFSALLMI